jgi:hypothetical protein
VHNRDLVLLIWLLAGCGPPKSAAATSHSRPPASKRRTIRSRPIGVSRANLCMFAEPSSEWVGGFATPSFTRYGSVNNLLINYT